MDQVIKWGPWLFMVVVVLYEIRRLKQPGKVQILLTNEEVQKIIEDVIAMLSRRAIDGFNSEEVWLYIYQAMYHYALVAVPRHTALQFFTDFEERARIKGIYKQAGVPQTEVHPAVEAACCEMLAYRIATKGPLVPD